MENPTRKFIPISPETHQALLNEKHYLSVGMPKAVTFDALLKDLLTRPRKSSGV